MRKFLTTYSTTSMVNGLFRYFFLDSILKFIHFYKIAQLMANWFTFKVVYRKKHKHLFGEIEIFHILFMEVGSKKYESIKTYQILNYEDTIPSK